jgi:methionine-gamma-lyase
MKKDIAADSGLGTIVNHYGHEENSMNAHRMPIYQTSTFSFPDVETGGKIYSGQQAGYVYTRSGSPNATHLANKYAFMEGLDIIRASPDAPVNELVAGKLTSSGLAATASAVFGHIGAGDTLITQRVLYGNTYRFWKEMAWQLLSICHSTRPA